MRMIYLDNHATTACDQRVVEKMLPYFSFAYGNSASSHLAGSEAFRAVATARVHTAELIGAHSDEIVFTSGATESINLALKASVVAGGHVITAATEHRAVLDTCLSLANSGIEVTILDVDGYGMVAAEDIRKAIRPNTHLVSIMHANNEIGVIQPITEIGQICREVDVLFHTDASQSLGKIPVDVERDNIDLLSGTAHKLYGPKGSGFLFARRRVTSRLRQNPLFHGGGHEGGIRSGTLNVPGIVGLGEAARISRLEMFDDGLRTKDLAKRLLDSLTHLVPHLVLNGHPTKRLPGNLNILLPGVDAQALIELTAGLCISTGSACSSQRIDPSHVLKGLGRTTEEAFASIRIGVGRFNTESEIDAAATIIADAVGSLMAMAL